MGSCGCWYESLVVNCFVNLKSAVLLPGHCRRRPSSAGCPLCDLSSGRTSSIWCLTDAPERPDLARVLLNPFPSQFCSIQQLVSGRLLWTLSVSCQGLGLSAEVFKGRDGQDAEGRTCSLLKRNISAWDTPQVCIVRESMVREHSPLQPSWRCLRPSSPWRASCPDGYR